MIPAPNDVRLVVRLLALALFVVILQVTFVSKLPLFGTNATLLPLAVAAAGLLCGSVPGAVFGFVCGFFADVALLNDDLGLTSLLLCVTGYGAGRLRELRDPQGALVPMVLGAAATAAVTGGDAVMQFLLGLEAPVSFLLLRQVLATILFNAIIALPVFALVRRWLLPVLPDDPRRRRRRAYTTGGLSPLSRS